MGRKIKIEEQLPVGIQVVMKVESFHSRRGKPVSCSKRFGVSTRLLEQLKSGPRHPPDPGIPSLKWMVTITLGKSGIMGGPGTRVAKRNKQPCNSDRRDCRNPSMRPICPLPRYPRAGCRHHHQQRYPYCGMPKKSRLLAAGQRNSPKPRLRCPPTSPCSTSTRFAPFSNVSKFPW